MRGSPFTALKTANTVGNCDSWVSASSFEYAPLISVAKSKLSKRTTSAYLHKGKQNTFDVIAIPTVITSSAFALL